MAFDPDAAAAPGSGIFGLPFSREEARVVLIPVPWEVTTSYGRGTGRGPAAILRASGQVDLFDRRFGRVYERGIYMEEVAPGLAERSAAAAALAGPIIEKGGAEARDAEALRQIDAAGEFMAAAVHARAAAALAEGKTPGLVGGEHAVSLGAIRACAEAAGEIGVLQVDAHMDLRERYEGFWYSHASIMWNVLKGVPGVTRLVQVGIRDFGEGELAFARGQGDRVRVHFDDEWAQRRDGGESFADLCAGAIGALPEAVYVSFDIDGLDPSLCPNTGTPVPGGLSFNDATTLLDVLRRSGRRVVGFDLVEVAPGEGGGEWDAAVGARVLYKLCGLAGR